MMPTGLVTLADYSDLFGWSLGWWVGCLLLLVLAIGGVSVVGYLRRALKEPDVPESTGFTLGDLRKLKQEGKMSEEEYQKASALITKRHTQELLAKPVAGAPKRPSAQDQP
jgi:hypothetical protein